MLRTIPTYDMLNIKIIQHYDVKWIYKLETSLKELHYKFANCIKGLLVSCTNSLIIDSLS